MTKTSSGPLILVIMNTLSKIWKKEISHGKYYRPNWKISNGVGVERTFPIHSPLVADVVVTRKGKPARAKLYYVRNLTGKAAKVKSAENN